MANLPQLLAGFPPRDPWSDHLETVAFDRLTVSLVKAFDDDISEPSLRSDVDKVVDRNDQAAKTQHQTKPASGKS